MKFNTEPTEKDTPQSHGDTERSKCPMSKSNKTRKKRTQKNADAKGLSLIKICGNLRPNAK